MAFADERLLREMNLVKGVTYVVDSNVRKRGGREFRFMGFLDFFES